MTKCAGPECAKKVAAKGMCHSHRQQQKRGSPLSPLRVVRSRAEVVARDANGDKSCNRCLEWMPEEKFGKHKNTLDGLQATCRECASRDHRRRFYGADLDEILERQGLACAICGASDIGKYSWHIDHNHSCCPGSRSCGKCVRGALCHLCNLGLGSFRDSSDSLMRAAKYIQSWEIA